MGDSANLMLCTSNIVSAYVAKNSVRLTEVERLIEDVYLKLKSLVDVHSDGIELVSAVPIEESVFPDYLICLEDGKRLKMLKRHLKTMYNMTVEEYKRKWGLPSDYPSVAKNYAVKRSVLAKQIGLGRKIDQQFPKVTLRVV